MQESSLSATVPGCELSAAIGSTPYISSDAASLNTSSLGGAVVEGFQLYFGMLILSVENSLKLITQVW